MVAVSEPPLRAPCSGAGVCPGCGALLPAEDGPTHPYIRASPACWARYGEVLAREFGDPDYFALHQLTVDAYAVQHPGVAERRAIQSVGLHLMTLCMVIEDGADPREGPKLHRRMVRRPAFEWLDPPPMDGRLTVAAILPAQSPSEHERLVRAWARDVWEAWTPHHETVRRWVRHSLA
ncbi:MAG: hypothetical protein H0X55_06055 [Thermoleophilaceae bacterium]|nr:hypothetical protein [Thermoleophilaceae bacterium]